MWRFHSSCISKARLVSKTVIITGANSGIGKETARDLYRREANIDGINMYSLHPGLIRTELGRHLDNTIFQGVRYVLRMIMPFFKNPEQGAQTTIYCSVDETIANETGLYYAECCAKNPRRIAKDERTAGELWNRTCRLLHYDPDEELTRYKMCFAKTKLYKEPECARVRNAIGTSDSQ